MSLIAKNIHVLRDGVSVVSEVNFAVAPGELHVLRGQNGAGKSSLLSALMGHPKFTLEGTLELNDEPIGALPTHVRARKGLFLSLQQPPEVTGVPVGDFLRTVIAVKNGAPPKTLAFQQQLTEALARLRLDPHFAERHLNVDFSGGEKKRAEILHLLMLSPKYAMLDEPDSGLDADAMEYVAQAIDALRAQGVGFLVVTHAPHFLERLKPDKIWTLSQGRLT